VLLGGIILLGVLSVPAHGQVLMGQVLEGTSGRPISDARLTLLHPDSRALGDPVLSDENGRFMLSAPGPGEYYLRAEKLGYLAIVDGIFAFDAVEGRLNVSVYMAPQPVDLAGIEARVEMRRIRRNLRVAGFYDRADAGFGIFVGPEEIKSRLTINVSDYLRRVPGIRFRDGRVLFRSRPDPRSIGDGLCEPTVYLDGVQLINGSLTPGGAASGQGLDDRVRPEEVVGIEVYRRLTEIPMEYYVNRPDQAFCGVLVVWTESGR